MTVTLASFVTSLLTWSAYQKFIKSEGEEAGRNLLRDFMEKYFHISFYIIYGITNYRAIYHLIFIVGVRGFWRLQTSLKK